MVVIVNDLAPKLLSSWAISQGIRDTWEPSCASCLPLREPECLGYRASSRHRGAAWDSHTYFIPEATLLF